MQREQALKILGGSMAALGPILVVLSIADDALFVAFCWLLYTLCGAGILYRTRAIST
jgi:hypothetical protein